MITNIQKETQQLLLAIEAASSQLQLKLPASRESIRRQVEQLSLIEEQLKQIREKVSIHSKRDHRLSIPVYRNLAVKVEELIQDARNFKHLAAEFPIDPEGTVSCLQSLNRRYSDRTIKKMTAGDRTSGLSKNLSRIECL